MISGGKMNSCIEKRSNDIIRADRAVRYRVFIQPQERPRHKDIRTDNAVGGTLETITNDVRKRIPGGKDDDQSSVL